MIDELADLQRAPMRAPAYLYADEMAALLGGALRPLARALGPAEDGAGDGEATRPEDRLRRSLVALAADFSETAQPALHPEMVASLQVHAAG
eukprot:5139940-Alexandrium_andersonii.AAC.1